MGSYVGPASDEIDVAAVCGNLHDSRDRSMARKSPTDLDATLTAFVPVGPVPCVRGSGRLFVADDPNGVIFRMGTRTP